MRKKELTHACWEIHTPQCVYNGSKSIHNLKHILQKESLERLFIIIDPKVAQTQFGKDIKDSLEEIQTFYWSDFTTNPTIEQAKKGAERLRAFQGDALIAIGGGSAIDVAKIIGLFVVNNDSLIMDPMKETVHNNYLPFVAVPTTCGTGAECSPYAIIKDCSMVKKLAIESKSFIPKYVILDPDALQSLSQEMIAATGLDTTAHAIEVHISRQSTPLVRLSTCSALVSLGKYLEKGIYQRQPEALEVLQDIAFTTRLLYPRTGLSIAHGLSHPLGAYTDLHHGMAVGLVMPAALRFNAPACRALLDEAASLLGVPYTGADGVAQWIEDILIKSTICDHIHNHFKGMEIPKKSIAKHTMESSSMCSNPRIIESYQEVQGILQQSLKLLEL